MRNERESEIASKYKLGMVGWIGNRMRLWRTRRVDRAAGRRDKTAILRTALALPPMTTSTYIHDHYVLQPRQGVLSQHAGGLHIHAPHGPTAVDRTDGPVMRRLAASQPRDV